MVHYFTYCPVCRVLDDRFGIFHGLAKRRQSGGVAAVSEDDGGIAEQSTPPRPPQGRPSEASPEVLFGQGEEFEKVSRVEVGAGLKLRVVGGRGVTVPGADFLADVAAEKPVADALTLRLRDGPFQLYRQV